MHFSPMPLFDILCDFFSPQVIFAFLQIAIQDSFNLKTFDKNKKTRGEGLRPSRRKKELDI